MQINEFEAIVEAVLFASGDSLSLQKIMEITNQDKKTTKLLLDNLIESYKKSNRGIMIRKLENNYQLCTKPEYEDYITMLITTRKKSSLSQAALEALSIIAYNQPVTKAYVEKIRGVNSDGVISKLQEKDLIKEAGRDDGPGKAKMYKTTESFLKIFGFNSIKELPYIEMNPVETVLENRPLD